MTQTSLFEQLLDPANRADPWPLYAQMRRTPVMRQEDGSYVVSTYREIVELLHDPRVSSELRDAAGSPGDADEEDAGGAPSFIRLDPPDHDRVRRLLTRQFGPPHSPRLLDDMVPEMEGIVSDLIDGLAGRTRVDLVEDVAYPFPVTVICRLLGVPLEDEPRFHAWADALIEAGDPRAGSSVERQHARRKIFAEVREYLGGLADDRRDRPGRDMLTGLVTDDGPEGRLSREEVMSNASLLLFAGHLTTVNLIAGGMLTLLRNPDVLGRLRSGDEPGLAVRVVEETLRYEPPVQFLSFGRSALDDIEIAGTTIPKGAGITLMLAAGNRDPEHVSDPDRFDPDRRDARREETQHLGFGGGIHYCFGAPLARLEGQIAFTELSRRLPAPRLVVDPPPYRDSPFLRGPRQLLVELGSVTSRETTPAPASSDAAPTDRS